MCVCECVEEPKKWEYILRLLCLQVIFMIFFFCAKNKIQKFYAQKHKYPGKEVCSIFSDHTKVLVNTQTHIRSRREKDMLVRMRAYI